MVKILINMSNIRLFAKLQSNNKLDKILLLNNNEVSIEYFLPHFQINNKKHQIVNLSLDEDFITKLKKRRKEIYDDGTRIIWHKKSNQSFQKNEIIFTVFVNCWNEIDGDYDLRFDYLAKEYGILFKRILGKKKRRSQDETDISNFNLSQEVIIGQYKKIINE